MRPEPPARCRAVAWSALVASALLGCPDRSEAKGQAAAIDRAIDALRDAPNDEKAPALDALRKLPCGEPEICAAQSACVAGYELHLRGLDGIAQAKQASSDARGAPGRAVQLLEQAQQDLERAKPQLERCTNAQGELARQYKL